MIHVAPLQTNKRDIRRSGPPFRLGREVERSCLRSHRRKSTFRSTSPRAAPRPGTGHPTAVRARGQSRTARAGERCRLQHPCNTPATPLRHPPFPLLEPPQAAVLVPRPAKRCALDATAATPLPAGLAGLIPP
eukprot:555302-Pyramimonas_sp.AAC.1